MKESTIRGLLFFLLASAEACGGGGGPGADGVSDADAEQADLPGETVSPGEARVVLVIIDGARYTEMLGDGDPAGKHTPNLHALAREGCSLGNTPILNIGETTTIYGVNTIHSGKWNSWVEDSSSGEVFQTVPTHWEYFRKQQGQAQDAAAYFLKYMGAGYVWKPSRHDEYGPDYWPSISAYGTTDRHVTEKWQSAVSSTAPRLSVLYLEDVDGGGHTGDWETYTDAIREADRLVGVLWQAIGADPAYAGKTTLIVTSDHGRHDDAHGGFQWHGDACNGCRRVTFLAVGPGVRRDCAQPEGEPYTIADITPTIGRILGYTAPYADGKVMDIFN